MGASMQEVTGEAEIPTYFWVMLMFRCFRKHQVCYRRWHPNYPSNVGQLKYTLEPPLLSFVFPSTNLLPLSSFIH